MHYRLLTPGPFKAPIHLSASLFWQDPLMVLLSPPFTLSNVHGFCFDGILAMVSISLCAWLIIRSRRRRGLCLVVIKEASSKWFLLFVVLEGGEPWSDEALPCEMFFEWVIKLVQIKWLFVCLGYFGLSLFHELFIEVIIQKSLIFRIWRYKNWQK